MSPIFSCTFGKNWINCTRDTSSDLQVKDKNSAGLYKSFGLLINQTNNFCIQKRNLWRLEWLFAPRWKGVVWSLRAGSDARECIESFRCKFHLCEPGETIPNFWSLFLTRERLFCCSLTILFISWTKLSSFKFVSECLINTEIKSSFKVLSKKFLQFISHWMTFEISRLSQFTIDWLCNTYYKSSNIIANIHNTVLSLFNLTIRASDLNLFEEDNGKIRKGEGKIVRTCTL